MTIPQEVENRQICVCYDVYLDEILEQIAQGITCVDTISDNTYACQGCGGCREKVEELVSPSADKKR